MFYINNNLRYLKNNLFYINQLEWSTLEQSISQRELRAGGTKKKTEALSSQWKAFSQLIAGFPPNTTPIFRWYWPVGLLKRVKDISYD